MSKKDFEMKNNQDNVIELDIECIEHSEYAYTYEEVEQMYWSGELTDWPPLDGSEFIADDWFDYCEKCEKYINN